jgi:tetratricopeptide (TPR) repeat protein
MYKSIFLFLITLMLCKNISAQVYISSKYKPVIATFDSLNNLNLVDAKNILLEVEKSTDFVKNDSVKLIVFCAWERFYITNSDINKVNQYCKLVLELSLKNKMYGFASTALGSSGMAYFRANKIDSALVCFQNGLQYAQKGNDTFNINKSLMAIANTYARQSKFKESNEILLANIDKIVNNETKAVAYTTIADNYMSLDSKATLDQYYLKA